MEKKKFVLIEKLMGLVYRAIDIFDESKKRKNKNSDESPIVVLTKTAPSKKEKAVKAKPPTRKTREKAAMPLAKVTVTKKMTSVRSGKKISSPFATQMLTELKNKKMDVVCESAEINGKKSLAWVVWALAVADKTKMQEGISIHDVSSLLYHAAKIEIYPINVSRMVHDNNLYIRQVSQDKKTKRYLLTDEGKKLVSALPLAKLAA